MAGAEWGDDGDLHVPIEDGLEGYPGRIQMGRMGYRDG